MAGLACACMPLPLESTDAVVVFLKVPTLHKTKTRLIPRFGAEGAYAIAQALAEDTLRRLGSSPLLDDARRVACFAPADGADRLERLAARAAVAGRFELSPMAPRDLASSDLGAALRAEYERVRATTPGAVVIVGMDAPDLPLDVVAGAATAARRGAAVVHDASDGGYVLLALPPGAPGDVFDGVEWSTDRTAASQRAALEARGVPLAARAGPPWPDVDEPGDVDALFARLNPTACPSLAAARADLTT